MTRHFLTAALTAALLLSTAGCAVQTVPPEVAAAVADGDRPAADKSRDANRKPAEVVAFAGVKSGMIVAELGPGGGYFTRILAKAVGPKGKVYAIASLAQAARPGGLDRLNAIAKDNPNVVVMSADYSAIKLPESADLFWTTENYHDFHNGPNANIPGLNKSVFVNLKPGGIFYVEDHSAPPGAGLAATSELHRMDEALAKAELIAAGFRIDAESNLLRNATDDKASKSSDSGNFTTDRFMLRLKRP